MKKILATLLTAAFAGTAGAATVPFAGATAPTPTFNRPVSLTALSAAGTAVAYTALPFTVDTAGQYTLTVTAPTYDPYIFLYAGAFNPASPLTNLINGDDDFDPDGTGPLTTLNGSQIAPGDASNFSSAAAGTTLSVGTTYVLVSSAFTNATAIANFGAFTGSIAGPGTATISAPEPTSVGLCGLAAAPILARRRRRTAA